jgi:hypothetical protein
MKRVLLLLIGCQSTTVPAPNAATTSASASASASTSASASASASASVSATATATAFATASAYRGLTRAPSLDAECAAPFAAGYTWSSSGSSYEELMIAVRNDPKKRGGPVSAPEAIKANANCYATGPHTAMNLANWCCK